MQWFDVYEYTGHSKQKSTFPFFGVKKCSDRNIFNWEKQTIPANMCLSTTNIYCDKWINVPLSMDEYI